eukprot:365353-Chlamydomonas_euryale.AAC.23
MLQEQTSSAAAAAAAAAVGQLRGAAGCRHLATRCAARIGAAAMHRHWPQRGARRAGSGSRASVQVLALLPPSPRSRPIAAPAAEPASPGVASPRRCRGCGKEREACKARARAAEHQLRGAACRTAAVTGVGDTTQPLAPPPGCRSHTCIRKRMWTFAGARPKGGGSGTQREGVRDAKGAGRESATRTSRASPLPLTHATPGH